jgi:flagellin-like hook-associated protein FlgL
MQELANTKVNGQSLFTGTSTHGRATGVAISPPVTITNGSTDTLTLTVDGTTSGTIDLTTATTSFTGAELATRVQSKINADATLVAAGKSVTVTYDTDHLVIASNSAGSSSTVEVTGGTSVTTLGFHGGSKTTGESPFARSATTGADLGNTGGGIISQGKVIEPDAVTLDDYIVKFSSATAFSVYNVSKPVTVTANTNNTGGAAVSNQGVSDSGLVRGDSYEVRVQSTYNVTSSNNALRFTPASGAATTISLTAGKYTGSQLATALEAAMEAASGGDTYTVSYTDSTGKFSIQNNTGNAGALTLSFENAATTAEDLLGFNAGSISVAVGSSATGNDATATSGATLQHNIYDSTVGSAIFNVTSSNNTIYRGGSAITLTTGSYTGSEMAAEIQSKLGSGYSVAYSTAATKPARKFTITNSTGGAVTFNWSNSGATAASLLGYDATDSAVADAGTDVSDFDAGNSTYESDANIDFDGLRVALKTGAAAPHDGDVFSVGHAIETVLANQVYTSGASIDFKGFRVAIRTGSSAPAASDIFRVRSGVQYQGDSGLTSIEIRDNQTVKTNLVGNEVFSGSTIDIFAAVKNLAAALNGSYGGGIDQGLSDIDSALQQISEAQGDLGALTNRLESTSDGLEQVKVLVQAALTQNEDVDIVKAISDLTEQQYALQAIAQAGSNIFELSLMNFLK